MSDILEKYPENGQMVFVRQRPAIVREVVTKNDPQTNKVQHLIDLEYIDGWNFPRDPFYSRKLSDKYWIIILN